MTLYLITYDKVNDRDYKPLWDALDRIGAQRVLLSTWLLENDSSAEKIFQWLQTYVDSNDRVLVTEIIAANAMITQSLAKAY